MLLENWIELVNDTAFTITGEPVDSDIVAILEMTYKDRVRLLYSIANKLEMDVKSVMGIPDCVRDLFAEHASGEKYIYRIDSRIIDFLVIAPTHLVEGRRKERIRKLESSKLGFIRRNLVGSRDLRAVILVDADNLLSVASAIVAEISSDQQMVCFLKATNAKQTDTVLGGSYSPYVHSVFSCGCTKEAADQAIAMEASILDMLLPVSVEFNIVSNDMMVAEIVKRISISGRVCNHVLTPENESHGRLPSSSSEKRSHPEKVPVTSLGKRKTTDQPSILDDDLLRKHITDIKYSLMLEKRMRLSSIMHNIPLSENQLERYKSWGNILTTPEVSELLNAMLVRVSCRTYLLVSCDNKNEIECNRSAVDCRRGMCVHSLDIISKVVRQGTPVPLRLIGKCIWRKTAARRSILAVLEDIIAERKLPLSLVYEGRRPTHVVML